MFSYAASSVVRYFSTSILNFPLLAGKKGLRAAALGAAVCLLAGAPQAAQSAQLSAAIITLGGGFSNPTGVAVDISGNVYVADPVNHALKEMPAGCASVSCVTTLGGGFSHPSAVAVDRSGNVYAADSTVGKVYEMPSGCASASCVTTLGGGFSRPSGVTVDVSGNVYVADYAASAVYKMPAGCASASCVTTVGGGFSEPFAIALDGGGNIYVTDNGLDLVTEMTADCTSASCVTTLGADFFKGGGSNVLTGVAVDGNGTVYVSVEFQDAVAVVPAGCASKSCVTLLGIGFSQPGGLAVDGSGKLYVTQTYDNSTVEEFQTFPVDFGGVAVSAMTPATATLTFTFTASVLIQAPAVLTQGAPGMDFTDAGTGTCNVHSKNGTYLNGSCTVVVNFVPKHLGLRYGMVELFGSAGNLLGLAYLQGTGVAPQVTFANTTSGAYLPSAQTTLGSGFNSPFGVAVDESGNVFVADQENNAVKEILAAGGYTTVNTLGSGFVLPTDVAVDGSGNVFVADYGNSAVKEILAAGGYTTVNTLGSGFSYPFGVALDGSGNVFVADQENYAVKEILAAGGYTTVNTLGSGFVLPTGVAVDGSGNVFVVEYYGGSVKEIQAAGGYTTVNTLGGAFSHPYGVALDGSGNVFVADYGNNAVKEILAAGSYTTVNTLGSGFSDPSGVAVDGSGNVFVGDFGNHRVLMLDYADPPSLSFASTAFGATSTDSPQTVTVSNDGNAALTLSIPGTGSNPSISSIFILDSSTTGTCPLVSSSSGVGTLAVGASCTLPISFEPTALGSLSGSLILTDNNLNGNNVTQTIALSGTATQATQTISFTAPASFSYGTPFTLSATASSGQAVSFASNTPSVCTVSGSTVTLVSAAANCTIEATQAGDSDYLAAVPVTQSAYVKRGTQVITFATIPSQIYAVVLPLSATASSGLTVSFASTTPSICTVSGTTATMVSVGTCAVQAAQGGNNDYLAAGTASRSFKVTQAAQTITFAALPTLTYGEAPFTVSATASTGLAVTFESTTPSICKISGTTVTVVGGQNNCTIKATQAGNSNYLAAPAVSRSSYVNRKPQAITFATIPSQANGAELAFSATSTSGLPVSFASATTSVCTVSGKTATMVSVGTCTIQATQAGNSDYLAAGTATRSFKVLASQTISFPALPSLTYGLAPFTVSATASSGLAVSFASTTPSICTVSGTTVTLVGAQNNCTIQVTQAGNSVYAAAAPVTQTSYVKRATQSITFATIPTTALSTGSISLSATASSGLAVSFASTTTGVCTVSGSTVTLVSAGTCTIQATQAGNSDYLAAGTATRSFTVAAD